MEEHFQESYCLRDWEGGVFLLAAFGQVSLRVLGQGVVAQYLNSQWQAPRGNAAQSVCPLVLYCMRFK